ncbi:transposase [Nocardia sp. NPDC059239]|uniref:transposase n=1 Tax=Nocardia sp. NPDC059239 TaxID=3346785 RepID=UPI0036D0F628
MITVKPAISPRYLSEDERITIADLRRRGVVIREIAAVLGRAPSTISRQLRRNALPGEGYRPFDSQRLAGLRRRRPGRGKFHTDPELAVFVQHQLDRRWSPAQISHGLRGKFPGQRHRHLSPEKIYQAIYRNGSGIRRPHRDTLLRSGHRFRRPDCLRSTQACEHGDDRPAPGPVRSRRTRALGRLGLWLPHTGVPPRPGS